MVMVLIITGMIFSIFLLVLIYYSYFMISLDNTLLPMDKKKKKKKIDEESSPYTVHSYAGYIDRYI